MNVCMYLQFYVLHMIIYRSMIKFLWHYGVPPLGHAMTVLLLNSHGYEHAQETCINHASSITEVEEVNRDSGFDEVKKATGKRNLSCIFSVNNLNKCHYFPSKNKEMLLWFLSGAPSGIHSHFFFSQEINPYKSYKIQTFKWSFWWQM